MKYFQDSRLDIYIKKKKERNSRQGIHKSSYFPFKRRANGYLNTHSFCVGTLLVELRKHHIIKRWNTPRWYLYCYLHTVALNVENKLKNIRTISEQMNRYIKVWILKRWHYISIVLYVKQYMQLNQFSAQCRSVIETLKASLHCHSANISNEHWFMQFSKLHQSKLFIEIMNKVRIIIDLSNIKDTHFVLRSIENGPRNINLF